MECKPIKSKVTSLLFYNASDTVTDENGVIRIKRKYGKFTREPARVVYPEPKK